VVADRFDYPGSKPSPIDLSTLSLDVAPLAGTRASILSGGAWNVAANINDDENDAEERDRTKSPALEVGSS
jgi:hypothetical protein